MTKKYGVHPLQARGIVELENFTAGFAACEEYLWRPSGERRNIELVQGKKKERLSVSLALHSNVSASEEIVPLT